VEECTDVAEWQRHIVRRICGVDCGETSMAANLYSGRMYSGTAGNLLSVQ
jgi:hypothetical protein